MSEREKALVRDFIEIWIQTHQEEMGEFEAEMELERLGLIEPVYGSTDTKTMRKYGSMPADLQIKLKKNFPALFQSKENNYWLFKEFPVFLISEKL